MIYENSFVSFSLVLHYPPLGVGAEVLLYSYDY